MIKRPVTLDGGIVATEKSEEFNCCNIIECGICTTGYKGGDSCHGGRTQLRLTDIASTDMQLKYTTYDGEFDAGSVSEVCLMFGGDSELDTFIHSLEFALEHLKKETKKDGSLKSRWYRVKKNATLLWWRIKYRWLWRFQRRKIMR